MKLYYYTAPFYYVADTVCIKYFADNLRRRNGVWLHVISPVTRRA